MFTISPNLACSAIHVIFSYCEPYDNYYHQENITERHHYGGARLLVLKEIILSSKIDRNAQIGTIMCQNYRDIILKQHIHLFRGAMGTEFVFMDDNAHRHCENIVNECLQAEDRTRGQLSH